MICIPVIDPIDHIHRDTVPKKVHSSIPYIHRLTRSSRPYLSACQQVVAEKNAQGTSNFEVVVPRKNPMEFLRNVLEDVILVLGSRQQGSASIKRQLGPR